MSSTAPTPPQTTSDTTKQHEGRRLLPDDVLAEERTYVIRRREEAQLDTPSTSEGIHKSSDSLWNEEEAPIGISLSGGGIRSATFNMGVLQALASKGVLKSCDYLSTVSGGGYIGGCVTSLLSGLGLSQSTSEEAKNPHGTDENNFPLNNPEQIHHLRKHGDYLITRHGLFRREALRAVGLVVTGTTCMILVFLLTMLLLAALFVIFTGSAHSGGLWEEVQSGSLSRVSDLVWEFPSRTWTLWIYFLGGAIPSALCAVYFYNRLWRKLDRIKKNPTPPEKVGETNNERYERRSLGYYGVSVFIITNALLFLLHLHFLPEQNLLVCAIFAFLGVFTSSLIGYIYAPTARGVKFFNRQYRSFMGGILCIGFYAFLSSASFILIILATTWMISKSMTDWQAILVSATGFIIARMTVKSASANNGGNSIMKVAFKVIFSLIVPIAILIALIGGIALCLRFTHCGPDFIKGHNWPWNFITIAGCTLLALILLFSFLNFNRISPHYFYRDRLAETYFQTDQSNGFGLVSIRDDEPLFLHKLHEQKNGAPYHLVQCAVNMPGSRDLARKDRNSDHFTFSKYYCGSTSTGYVATANYRNGNTKLIRAVAISAAAASSLMGKLSTSTFAFILTLFNIRLGYWMPNPIYSQKVKISPLALGRYHSSKDDTPPQPLALIDKKGIKLKNNPWGFSWIPLFLHELFNTATADTKYINLSDGNHAGDNLAIYPLLQRRCKTIICCDAEADPNYECASLVSVINQIFVDENITIDIDLNEIRPLKGETLSKAHILIGTIHYPKETGYKGKLLYIKSSFMNQGEPPAVKGYAATHPKFPQQTTGDQFFDDDQFEAYRSLGFHIAKAVNDSMI